MKPDGVATTPAEPADDVVESVPEAAGNEEQVQQDLSPSSPQPEKPDNEGEQEGANSTLPPPEKEVNGKFSKPKDKTKAPVKTKPGTAGTKATTTTGTASRPAIAQNQVANGVLKKASNGASKKLVSMSSEMKKSAPVGGSPQVKKVPIATTVAPRTQVKAAERKAVGSVGSTASTSSGTRKTAAAAALSTLSKKPVTGGSNTAVKPKTPAASRPTTAPAAKANVSAASKAAPIPKTTRPTVAAASCPTTSSVPIRPTTTASKSTALRKNVSAPSAADSSQPSKVSTTVAAKKDIKTTISAAARKPLASTTTRSTATKSSKPEPPKPGTAAKRSSTDAKTSQPKTDETRQVPTRKAPSSSRNISSRPASGSNHKQGISSKLVSVKHQTAKPTHSVLPLVIKGKPSEQSSEPVEPSAILEATASVTTAAIAPVESVIEAQTPSVELAQPDQQTSALVESQGEGVQVPASETTNVDTVSTEETIAVESLAMQSVANVPVLMSNLPTVVPESEKVHDTVSVVIPMAQEMTEQELVTASLCEVSITAQVPPKDLDVVEKQEEEEEREGSQQVSVSDMSGTQPTEESRPGSAGLAGSVWQAGGLPSEFDSEDVSCSQQGASELSAPGVLEGTESMDDLGEASLKGADEVASAGSPDFEKFPDIPVNEDDDDDDEDRVDYMEVGSEMTEDPFRQCNDNEDEDDDVEMASEAVTESGLESYGNADEDDFAEDYRLDNLNRMQPSSIVPTALSAANPFADAWSLQPEPLVSSPSNPWQVYSQLPNQPTAQACLDIGSAKTDPSSQSPSVMDPDLSSPQPSSEPAAEMDMGLKQSLASHSQHISQSSTLLDPELAIHTCSDSSTPEELKDYSISPGLENQKPPLTVSLIPASLPDIMQDLRICRSDHAGSEHEEDEPETLPADDMLVQKSSQLTDQPSLHSSATGDEASDTEGDLQLSDPTEPGSTGNECFDSTQVVHSMSALVEECEEACIEMEGGGGSDTPQSATSAASYGFECTISNANAPFTTESCIKSLGIFSLENEEQLPEESKDTSLIKELNLATASTYSQLPNQPANQSCLDIGSAKTDLSSPQSPSVMDPDPSSPQPSSEPAAEMDMGLKQGLASHSQHISQSSTLLDPELAIHTFSDSSTCEELKDYNISPGLENQKPPLTVSLVPASLPDIMQDVGICRSDHAGSEHEEEEFEILPADDMLVQKSSQLTDQPSLHSSAPGDEASDTEGDLQLSDPTEPGSTGNDCFDSTQVVHSMSALVEECEEACVEMEGGGGDTPQSATSAASYGFECTTSNSNALSTTESCIKSPGIFSLENEEQLPEESKDASLIKELNLAPANASADVDQQGESQLNSEQQYMLCGKGTEELPEPCSPRGTVSNETGLDSSSYSEHQDLDCDAPHPYYSTISEKTDSFLTGSDLCVQQQEKVPTVHTTRPPKHHSGLRVDHVTRLPTDLPPRMPNLGCNTQLRRLEQHQQQLEEIEQRREQQSRRAGRQMEEREEKNQVAGELEQKNREKNETELEVQRRDLLHLQIQQQQQDLKQRQQVMQWQQELEQQKQSKHQNSHQKNATAVLSPSGLCTIYEALEISDSEEDFEDKVEEREILLKVKVEHECSPKERSSIPEAGSSSDNPDSPQSTLPFPNLLQDREGQTRSVALDSPPLSGSSSCQQPSPLELDWSKKADIVQQLINQTLLLNGDNCSPLLLLPGGAAGTLSPLETSLWPSLSTLTPPSATVTSVSSFSAEISGSSPQGEWTVVELETHH